MASRREQKSAPASGSDVCEKKAGWPQKTLTTSAVFAYMFDRLAVLTVVHLPEEQAHIISFRTASKEEREVYHEWLENDYTA
jgi:hypothetical protein